MATVGVLMERLGRRRGPASVWFVDLSGEAAERPAHIERRLSAVQPGAGTGFGRAVLACPAGEHHVLGLLGLGIGLR